MKKILVFFLFFISFSLFATEKVFDEKGYLVEQLETSQDGTVRSVLTYSDGKLVFTTRFLNDESSPYEVEYYLRSPVNGSLIGVKRYKGTNLVGGNYLYSEEKLFLNATDNLVFTDSFEIQSDGNITLTDSDGTINTYSPEGLLIRKELTDSVQVFTYDEERNLLTSTKTTSGTDLVEECEYKEGKKYLERIIDNEIILSSTIYEVSGKIVTMYENGKALAEVKYYQDNRRVREIIYL